MSVIGATTSFVDHCDDEEAAVPITWAVYLAATIVGAESLLVYNALLTAQTFFHDAFGSSFAFASMIFYSGPMCLCQLYMIFKGDSYTLTGRMRFGFVGVFAANAALLLVVLGAYSNKELMYCCCLGAIVLLSITSAVMQSGLMGFCAALSPVASAAAMLGFGLCGLMSFGLGELFLWMKLSLQVNTTYLFLFCLGFTVFAGLVNERILLRGSARDVLRDELRPTSQASQMSQMDVNPTDDAQSLQEPMDTKSVLRAIFPQALNVFLVFAVSLAMFPGVVVAWKVDPPAHSQMKDQASLTTLIIGMFQVFDVVGRYGAGPIARCIPPRSIIWFVLIRFLFIPLFMMGQRDPGTSWLWGSDHGRCLLMALFAGTNGFFGSLAMMFGPELVSKDNRSVAGTAMSTSMVWGIFFGSLVAPISQIGVAKT